MKLIKIHKKCYLQYEMQELIPLQGDFLTMEELWQQIVELKGQIDAIQQGRQFDRAREICSKASALRAQLNKEEAL